MCSVHLKTLMRKWNDAVLPTFNLCECFGPFVELEEPSTMHGYRIHVLDFSPFWSHLKIRTSYFKTALFIRHYVEKLTYRF